MVVANDFPIYLVSRETMDLPNMYRVWILSNIRFSCAAIRKTFSIEVSANDPPNVGSIRVVFLINFVQLAHLGQEDPFKTSPARKGKKKTYGLINDFVFNSRFFIQQCMDIFDPQFNATNIQNGIDQTNTNYGGYGIASSKVGWNQYVDEKGLTSLPLSTNDDKIMYKTNFELLFQ